jgi:hypothetical protein
MAAAAELARLAGNLRRLAKDRVPLTCFCLSALAGELDQVRRLLTAGDGQETVH